MGSSCGAKHAALCCVPEANRCGRGLPRPEPYWLASGGGLALPFGVAQVPLPRGRASPHLAPRGEGGREGREGGREGGERERRAAWLQLQPTPELALADGQFAVVLTLRLGVPLLRGDAGACRFCAGPRDVWGVHDRSCVSGGDNVCRHNAVRGLVYEFARRANVDPHLERSGIFAGPGLRVELRRPADVLVRLARRGGARQKPPAPLSVSP